MAAGNQNSCTSELESGSAPNLDSSSTANSATSIHRRDRFNPCVIVLQILVLQVVYYFALAVFTGFVNWFFSVYPTDFSAQLLGSPAPGIQLRTLAVGTILAAAGPTGLTLALLVRRARRCADHAVTLLLAHIIICLSLHGLPRRAMWWVLQISATVIMTIIAESLCRIIEARERVAFTSHINAAAKSIAHIHRDDESVSDPPSPDSRSRVSFSVSKLAGSKRSADISKSEEEVSLLVDEV